MLVLTRRLDETILIGDDIEIRIVQVRGSGDQAVVRLGISAPKHITVLRKEVHDEVVASNRQSAQVAAAIPSDLLAAAKASRSKVKEPDSGTTKSK
ncbi:MAG TPA: carbon storage regulator CsrA [Symbiobacteriaceae bacterium]|nr:carbon storage regulator CsrA [Symbiobacteriaceae bacterium]